MIVRFNPISTTPGKQPLPLSLMSLAAVLEGPTLRSDLKVGTEGRTLRSDQGRTSTDTLDLVDGNIVPDPAAEIIAQLTAAPRSEVSLLAVSVMPGPQRPRPSPSARA
jgi:hypothetical protein